MANLDPTRWYQITVGKSKDQSLSGTGLYNKGLYGAVFFENTNLTDTEQQWQIFPYNSSYSILRTKASGARGYLHASLSDEETTPGSTRADTRNASIADNSIFWNIQPWGDGTFWMANAMNGTAWHMNRKSDGLVSMSSNITAPQNGQTFSFSQLSQIENPRFSSVVLPEDTATSTLPGTPPSATPTDTPQPTSAPTSGIISTGAKAAIGASIGGAAAIALLIFAWWFMRRRKAKKLASIEGLPAYPEDPKAGGVGDWGKESYTPIIQEPGELDGRTTASGSQNSPVELDGGQGSVELSTAGQVRH